MNVRIATTCSRSKWIMMLSWGGYIWHAEYLIVVSQLCRVLVHFSICCCFFSAAISSIFRSYPHFSPHWPQQSYILCEIGINYPNLLWCCSLCSYLLLHNMRFVSLDRVDITAAGLCVVLAQRYQKQQQHQPNICNDIICHPHADTVCFWLFSIFPVSKKDQLSFFFSYSAISDEIYIWNFVPRYLYSKCVRMWMWIWRVKADSRRVHITI